MATIKEEPKQIKCYCGHTTYCDCGQIETTPNIERKKKCNDCPSFSYNIQTENDRN